MKNLFKRTLSMILAVVMVFGMLPNLAPHVHAASGKGSHTVGNVGLSWTNTNISSWGQKGSVSYTTSDNGLTLTASGNGGIISVAANSTLTITNNGAAGYLAFDWEVSGSGKVSGLLTSLGSGTYQGNELMAAGGKSTITIETNKGDYSVTLKITNIRVIVPADKEKVTFMPAAGGSYSVTPSNTATEQLIDKETVFENDKDVTYQLSATPDAGYVFYGWLDGNGNTIDKTNPYTLDPKEDMSVTPLFVDATVAVFGVGNRVFTDLNAADQYALSNGNKIVLLNSGTLAAGNYTISAKNTLLIPFDEAHTVYTTRPGYIAQENGYTTPYVFRKLTMAPGATLTVHGTLSVSAMNISGQSGGPSFAGAPTGACGFIDLQAGSLVDVKDGGKLYVWGYIVGDGKVVANYGSVVYESMQVMDYRGGTGTTSLLGYEGYNLLFPTNKGAYKGTFVFSQYYIQNVEAEMTIHYGALLNASTSVYLAGSHNPMEFKFIGTSNGMFAMDEGATVTKKYDGKTDRLILDAHGQVYMRGISISVSNISADSKEYVLPLNGNMTVNVHNGSIVTIEQDVALLPGAQIYVEKGATIKINSGNKMFVYDADQWDQYEDASGNQYTGGQFSFSNGYNNDKNHILYYAYSRDEVYKNREVRHWATADQMVDAYVDLNGTIIVEGELYTTRGGAQIVSSKGTGKLVFNAAAGTQTYTYQVLQNNTDLTLVYLPIDSVRLQNQNGTYTATAGATAGTIYYWNNDCRSWTKDRDHGHVDGTGDGDHLCDDNCGEIVNDCIDQTIDGKHICDECKADITDLVCKDTDKNHDCDSMEYDCTNWDTGKYAHQDSLNDGDHVCDYCGNPVKNAFCYDDPEDGNHVCDECDKELEPCVDNDKDHKCDNDRGCDKWITGDYAHTSEGGQHICDYCKKGVSDCIDKDRDHRCDYEGCESIIGEHADYDDDDHFCDYCEDENDKLTPCIDGNKDHKCDECGVTIDGCVDTDENHYCDYSGCAKKISECIDVNPGDHFCDYAGCEMKTSTCADNNEDHLCDICSKELTKCADTDKDHNCDLCGAALSVCADAEKDGDHKCDWCGAALSACADSESDGNHKCDECGAENVTACGDSGKDHVCDTDSACAVYNSGDNAHKDGADADHTCDYCQGSVGEECYDDNHDHVCDECGKNGVNEDLCVDENHDHVCDYGADYEDGCKVVHGKCVDGDKDHYCDYGAQVEDEDRCVAFYGECKDSSTDDDHVCDYGCGKVLEACEDCDWTYVDNQNGTHDASCSVCDEQMVNDATHNYDASGACVCGNTAQAKIGEVYYCFFVDAVANAQDGETVILCKDVTLNAKLTVENKQIWALGENTLKTANGDENYSLVVKGHLTVNSGKIVVTGWYGIGVLGQMIINGGEVAYEGYNDYLIGNWGTLVVNGGTFNGQYCCVNNFNGTTTINGGTFTTKATDATGEFESSDLLADAGLVVKGGSFSKDVTAFCDAEHHTVISAETGRYEYGAHTDCAWNYTDNGDGSHDADCSGCGLQMIDHEKHGYNETGACVCGNTADAKIGETYYYSFADALKEVKDGQTITLLEEITVTEVVVIEGKSVTIKGHTINSSVTDLFTVGKGGVLTLGEGLVVNNTSSILWVKDGGKVTVAGAKLYSKNTVYTAAYVEGAGSELTVTGGEIVSEKTSALCADLGAVITVSGGVVKTQNALLATAFSMRDGKIVLTGGEMRNGTGAAGESYTLIAANDGIVEMTGGYVSNGVLAHESANAKATISGGVIDGYVGTNNGATLIVTGGEFANDATKYCAYEYHTVDVDADGYYEYGTHVYVEGHCACGHIQDLHISLVIKADEMDPYEQFVNDVKYGNYGEALEIVLDFSKIDLTCITLGDASLTIGGKEDVPYRFEDGKFIIASELITGNIEIVVQAVQRHEVGDVVMKNYQAADFEHNESYDLVAYCAKCGLVIKTTHYEYEGTKLHAVAQIGEAKYESLEEAIAAANVGDTIVLLEKVVVEGAKVWDLTGITVKIADVGYDYGLIVRDELTINGGNFVMEGFYGIGVAATGKLTINGGNFSVAGDNDYLIGSYGTVVINGGTFVGQYNCVNGFQGTVTVNGGDFTVAETDCTGDYESEPVQGYATVYGGVFNNAYVADYLAEGYCVAVKNDKFVVGQHIAGDAVVENVVDATCTEKGSYDSVTYCAHCGEEMSRKAVSVEMLEHTANETVVENRKDATCTQKGSYDNVTYCACGEELNRETVEIPATGHIAGEAVIENVNNATCTAGGSYDVATYCVTCNEKLSSKTIETDALGHNWVPHTAEPATCTTAGWEQHICSVCNTLSEKTTIPATGHVAGEAVIENVNDATCTAGGSYDVATYCVTCNEKLSSKTIETDALGHNWVPHTAEPATCTTAGWEQHICSVCNTLSEKATIPATGHTMGKVVTENKVEPTCTEDGSYDMVVYCATCSCEISRTAVSVAATGHQYVKTVVAPTCTQMGYTTYTCACGYSYDAEYVPVISHSYEMEVTLAPSCTQKGVRTYTCSSCGHTKTEEIAATGHAWDTGVETKPTCTEGGYTTYTCTTCGSSYETNYTAATGHTWDEGAVDYAPTCTGDGRLVYTCACGAKRHEKIDAIGHDYRATVTDPTCTNDGYTTHTCANCGDSYVDSRVDALGHSWGDDVVTKPTCTAEGYTTHTCTVCSYSYVDSRVPATGHNYNDVVTDPTCTADGYTSHTCVVCGHAYTDGVVPATGHNYDEKVTLAPGCTTRGEKTHTCINCGDAYVEPIAATGHKYEANVIPPTCTIPGYTSYVCSVCGDAYDGDVVPATGHTYKAVVTAPTCTEEGYTTYTCSVCNHSHVADPVAPTGHAIGQIVTENYKAPTCTEDGSYDMVIYCATCDEAFSRTAWTIEATGHQYVVAKTAPTCTEKGYTTYTCHCGDSYIADYVDALGHVYETNVTKPTCTEKGYTTYTCHCGDSYIADYVDALGHTAGEPVKEYGEDGTYYDEVVYCAECGEELSRVRVDLYVLGDVNGDGEIDVLDAMLVAQYIVGDVSDDAIVLAAADVNGDGEIDVLDAMMIAQYIVGDVTSFPAEEEKKS